MDELKWINRARTDRRPFIQVDLWILALQKFYTLKLLEGKNQIVNCNECIYVIDILSTLIRI